MQSGSLVYTSGQLPSVDGVLTRTGKVGDAVTTEQAAAAAQVCALNALAAIHDLVGLDNVVRIVKVVGFVASAPGFTDQPLVVNGASEFLGKILGDAGIHAHPPSAWPNSRKTRRWKSKSSPRSASAPTVRMGRSLH